MNRNYKITFDGKVLIATEMETANFILALTGGGITQTATIKAMTAQRKLDDEGRLELKTKAGKTVLFETIPKS
jgi:co-chaperonin GroES (HSP10)